MRLHPSWNHPHPFSKLTLAGARGAQRALSRTIGAGGHQGHFEAATERHGIRMRIHPQGHARGLSRLPVSAPQGYRHARCGRHQPGMRSRPAALRALLLRGRQGLVKGGKALLSVGDDDQALMRRPALQGQQAPHPACTARVAAQTKHGLGGVGNQAAAAQVGAQGAGSMGESLHGCSVPNRCRTDRIKP